MSPRLGRALQVVGLQHRAGGHHGLGNLRRDAPDRLQGRGGAQRDLQHPEAAGDQGLGQGTASSALGMVSTGTTGERAR